MKNLRIRQKIKPSKDKFDYEVLLPEVYDMSAAVSINMPWVKGIDRERHLYTEIENLISIIKTSIEKYKIIKHYKRNGKIETKILLKKESDVVILTLAGGHIIERIYKYI